MLYAAIITLQLLCLQIISSVWGTVHVMCFLLPTEPCLPTSGSFGAIIIAKMAQWSPDNTRENHRNTMCRPTGCYRCWSIQKWEILLNCQSTTSRKKETLLYIIDLTLPAHLYTTVRLMDTIFKYNIIKIYTVWKRGGKNCINDMHSHKHWSEWALLPSEYCGA